MMRAAHRCRHCSSTLLFFGFDPEPGDSYPVFYCTGCGDLHVTRGCCWEKSPTLEQWTIKPKGDKEGD